ncbi:MAG: phosphotransferase system HPr-like phosphotransfer protein [Chlamydiales bacterium]|jgi:phosphotransferase system HPr-like phosphotransfer protein
MLAVGPAMTERHLEKLVPEQEYIELLEDQARVFFMLANGLLASGNENWTKRHFFQAQTEADELEVFLDDYGARYNRTYHLFTELVASIRGFAIGGLSLAHLAGRLEDYGVLVDLAPDIQREAAAAIEATRSFVQGTLQTLLEALVTEARNLGLVVPTEAAPHGTFAKRGQRYRLPRNLDQEELQDEEQRIAEVCTKYLQACKMFEEARVRPIAATDKRRTYLRRHCLEEHARVYEATVHNLQSAYDTYIKNTVLEGGDVRLPRLRGHISCCLHMLEVVTQLTHFVERHESGARTDAAEQSLAKLVDPALVHEITLNKMLVWANTILRTGSELAQDLLPSYTNVQTLEIELEDGVTVHARPASLIMAIVNHHGTPVEFEVAGQRCNAGSILELMIAIGSNPEERCYTMHGDERPLRDLKLLFEHQLGENGINLLPAQLDYLKNR